MPYSINSSWEHHYVHGTQTKGRYTCTHQRIVDELYHNSTMECHMIAIVYNYDIITTCKSSSCKDTCMYTA